MEKDWAGLPYYPISEFYKSLFNEKVYKIPVSTVDSCPNREGLKGMETCIFCDEWGSAAKAESIDLPLKQQIETYKNQIQKRFKSKAFLVYFQAYTNSFTKINTLKENFETALSYPFVKGFVLGTRPDCLSPLLLKLWSEYHERSHVSIELGVQSFFDDDLVFMKRGHTRAQSLEGILKIKKETPVDLGIHLIFGNPHESIERIKETAQICNDLPISNIKLHNLHVLKNTPLEFMYAQNQFTPIDLPAYAEKVKVFLQHLRPDIAIHRLSAFSSRWEELIAPAWTSDKMGAHQAIIDHMRKEHSFQSELFFPTTEREIEWRNLRKNKSRSLREPRQD